MTSVFINDRHTKAIVRIYCMVVIAGKASCSRAVDVDVEVSMSVEPC